MVSIGLYHANPGNPHPDRCCRPIPHRGGPPSNSNRLGRRNRCFPCKADSRFSSKAAISALRVAGRSVFCFHAKAGEPSCAFVLGLLQCGRLPGSGRALARAKRQHRTGLFSASGAGSRGGAGDLCQGPRSDRVADDGRLGDVRRPPGRGQEPSSDEPNWGQARRIAQHRRQLLGAVRVQAAAHDCVAYVTQQRSTRSATAGASQQQRDGSVRAHPARPTQVDREASGQASGGAAVRGC